METETKLCKDCRFCVPRHFSRFLRTPDYVYANCGRPDRVSLVDGSAKASCEYERKRDIGGDDVCGREAKYFQPKGGA
jgi:hypothetical protein